MLPKKIRLTTALFEQVFKTGKVIHSPSFWLRYLPINTGTVSRMGVVVPKKVKSTAVGRNKIKRSVFSVLEKLENLQVKPHLLLIGVKKDTNGLTFAELEKEMQDLLLKIGQK